MSGNLKSRFSISNSQLYIWNLEILNEIMRDRKMIGMVECKIHFFTNLNFSNLVT